METQLLLNKTIYLGTKALRVIKFTLIICLLDSFCTYSQKQQSDTDIIKLICEKKYKKDICLIKKNSNKNLILEIKQIKKFRDSNDFKSLDSMFNSLNIKESYIKNVIFNNQEIENYIKQEINSDWNKDDLEKKGVCIQNINKQNINNILVYISKPIYSIDKNFALIYVGIKNGFEYFSILKKEKKKWKEYKFIPLGIS